ncbi:MAG: hypothetical protein ACYC0V_03065 [Armatimonadota bacterium]
MRKLIYAGILLLILCAGAYAVGDQAYLGIFAETSLTKMPGMPAMPDFEIPPGSGEEGMPDMSQLGDLGNLPGMPDPSKLGGTPDAGGMPDIMAMMSFGKPQRQLNVRLWSPTIAAPDAFAFIVPPAGLKQGKKLDLELYRPKPETTSTGPDGIEPDSEEIKPINFTIKIYWGSSEKVRPGQPKIIKVGDMPVEQKARMEQEMRKASKGDGSQYFYKPGWTTAYWPTKKQPGKIANDASLLGNFALTTNYTGNIAIDVPKTVDFMAPIEMSSPDLEQPVSMDSFIPFKWTAIPNALGLHAQITGMQGQDTLILWFSSEKEPEMAVEWDYLQMAKVLEYVKADIMMKGTQTSMTVPEAIFKDCDMAMFRMIGYGTGTALAAGQPIPRVQTKTTLSITPLGGKMTKDMMSGMDAPSEEE